MVPKVCILMLRIRFSMVPVVCVLMLQVRFSMEVAILVSALPIAFSTWSSTFGEIHQGLQYLLLMRLHSSKL